MFEEVGTCGGTTQPMCTPWQVYRGARHDIKKQVHQNGGYNIGNFMDYVNFTLELTI